MEKTPKLEKALRGISILAGLDARQVSLLANCASERTFAPETLLLREGQPAESFYIVTAGTVAVEVHGAAQGRQIIQTVEPGDVVGWSWMIEPYHWHFDARAKSTTDTVMLDARQLRDHCDRDHEFGYAILKCFTPVIVHRLDAARMQLMDVYRLKS